MSSLSSRTSALRADLQALLSALQVLGWRLRRRRAVIVGLAAAVSLLLIRRAKRKRDYFIRDLGLVGKGLPRQAGEGTSIVNNAPEYDVIIVGGGTAGCVLASRLSEDPTVRVLLLEAGGSGVNLPFTRIPAAYSRLFHTKHDYGLHTVPQSEAGGRSRYWPRGKMLGGCSSINAMMFQCGAPSDYDEWARLGGEEASSWSYKNLQKYFLKFEKFSPSKSFASVDSSLRGAAGPIQTGYFGNFSRFSSSFVEACKEVGIPYRPDINTASGTLGTSKIMTYIDSTGSRVSTESAYLTEHVLRRPNLKVAIHATTTKVLLESVNGDTRAVGVEFAQSEHGTRFVARARKEVVLSAGAVHTPQILMLSGIGPAEQLAQHLIPVLVDLPGVGQNLIDHPVVDVNFHAKRGESINYVGKPQGVYEIVKTLGATLQYLVTRKGPLTTNVGESAAFVRSSDAALFPPVEYGQPPEDATSGPDAPDIELFATPVAYKEHGYAPLPQPSGELVALHAVLLRPTSKGSISLRSSNPFKPPVIDPRYLDTQHDVDVLVRALQLLGRLVRTNPLASVLRQSGTHPELDHRLHELSAEQLQKIVRDRVETLYHPTSTARMMPRDQGGVVDASLRVHGVPNLRVVDASIFPNIIAGHTAAPVIAVAEKAADLIRTALKA